MTLLSAGCASLGEAEQVAATPPPQRDAQEPRARLVLSYTLTEEGLVTSIESNEPRPSAFLGSDAIAALMAIKNMSGPK